MSTVLEIEDAIKQLPPEQMGELRRWFDEFLSDQWDARIEADAGEGKLDFLLERAEFAQQTGKARPFAP